MIGKNLIPKRGVMIAVAVIALMTLTASVAAAASMKAKKIEASGDVTEVGLVLGATVDSKFKIKDGVIKSVKIKTTGENVLGDIDDWINCEEKGKHSEDACEAAQAILDGAEIDSTHTSKAKLKVITHLPAGVVGANDALLGTLKGSLKAELTIIGANDDKLTGSAKLKIRSTEEPSIYQCLIGVDPSFGLPPVPVFGDIEECFDSSGVLGLWVDAFSTYVHPVTGLPIVGPGPVMIPVVLHVKDTGTFKVSNDSTKIKGKISVTVDSVGGTASGPIVITKGKAEFGD